MNSPCCLRVYVCASPLIFSFSMRSMSYQKKVCIFFNSNRGWWSPTGPTWHVGHQLAYCTCPRWILGWRISLTDHWQEKPKYLEKTCLSATLSTTNPIWPDRALTRATAVGSQRLTAWAMTRPEYAISSSQIFLLSYMGTDRQTQGRYRRFIVIFERGNMCWLMQL
jgi:hypothetical protein